MNWVRKWGTQQKKHGWSMLLDVSLISINVNVNIDVSYHLPYDFMAIWRWNPRSPSTDHRQGTQGVSNGHYQLTNT